MGAAPAGCPGGRGLRRRQRHAPRPPQLRAGDFTCTVVGDSYIIRDGRIAEPLRANAIRINDNIATILNDVVGVTRDVRGTVVWAADEVAYTPELAVAGVRVDAIAGFMEDLA